jgi:CBS domain-containing protein
MKTANDVMQKKVVTASPHMTLHELSALLIDHEITGAPVVNAAGLLVGVISQTDMVRHEREIPEGRAVPGYYMEERLPASFRPESPDQTRVRDCMTPIVISAERGDDVRAIARMMLEQKIHRIIIARKASSSAS